MADSTVAIPPAQPAPGSSPVPPPVSGSLQAAPAPVTPRAPAPAAAPQAAAPSAPAAVPVVPPTPAAPTAAAGPVTPPAPVSTPAPPAQNIPVTSAPVAPLAKPPADKSLVVPTDPEVTPEEPAAHVPAAPAQPQLISSYNSSIVRASRHRGQWIFIIVTMLVIVLVYALVGYWISIGSPTSLEQVPFYQQLQQTGK